MVTEKLTFLVHYEIYSNVYEAITKEKFIKKWKRQGKIYPRHLGIFYLIEQTNPQWIDLYIGLF